MLAKEQLKLLIDDYLKTKSIPRITNDTAFKEAVAFIESEFGDYLNLAAIASGNSEYNKERELFHNFLNNVLSYNEKDLQFNFNKTAAKASAYGIHQKIDFRDIRSLHGQSSNLGIREKYLKNTLGSQEWLSDLDLERSLESMQLRDTVHITRFNSTDIGMQLHFAREKKRGSSDPYSIPLLLNKGSEGRQSGSHWFAALITVDPTTNRVSYQVKDSFKLTDEQKKEMAQTIKQAINFKDKSVIQGVEATFEAFPNSVIIEEVSTIVGEKTQNDSYSCGYRALHALLNDPLLASVVNANIKAKAYADCATDSQSLVRHFYQEQLNNLVVNRDLITTLQREADFLPAIGQSSKVQLYPDKVKRYLDQMSSPIKEKVPVEPSAQMNPVVAKKLNEFSILKNSIHFPGTDDKTLTSGDYEDFLLNLQVKLKEHNKTLEKLIISPCTPKSLDGLNLFSANDSNFRINELAIELADLSADDANAFVEKLKTLLINMSEKDLKKISISDSNDKISAEQWQVIASVVKDRGIKVDLLLPEKFQSSPIQRDIDQSVSSNRFMLPSLAKQPQKTEESLSAAGRKKRQRPRQGPSINISVDIELQQEQQVEVSVERQKMGVSLEGNPDFGDLELLQATRFDGFYKRLNAGTFNIPKACYLLSETDAKKAWQSWFGHLDKGGRELRSKHLYGITKQACEQLLSHSKHYKMGLDFNHLPQGFVVLEYPPGSQTLHYDALSLLFQKKQDPLAVVIIDPPKPQALAHPLFVEVIKKLETGSKRDQLLVSQWKILQNAKYDRDAIKLFQEHLPKLLTYNENQLKQLFDLTFETNQLNKEQFALIINEASIIADLFSTPTSLETPYKKQLVELFGSPEKVKSVVTLAKDLQKNPPQAQSHLLSQLLAEKPKLLALCQSWCGKIPSINTDALLQVYSQLGEEGLNQLFSQWDTTDSKVLQTVLDTLFSNGEGYEPFIDKKYQDALSAIQGFSEAQKEWWDKLLQQHGKGVGHDDLPQLVESFKAFSQAIEKKGLRFDKLSTDSFSEVQSMPIALARMLTILNNCQKQDLEAQWGNISRLSLTSGGAIRAITDSQKEENKCQFVTPEMTEVNYDALRGYKPSEDWHDLGNFKTLDEAKKEFYKAIAHQKHRLPISFYDQALAKIDAKRFAPEVKIQLVALLYASTTGSKNHLFLQGEKESLTQLDLILNTLDNLPLPSLVKAVPKAEDMLRQKIIEKLYDLSYPPSLPVLNQLIKVISNSLKLETNIFNMMSEFTKKLNSLEKTFKILHYLTKKHENFNIQYGDAIYEGMRFYADQDFASKDSIFDSHLEAAAKLSGLLEDDEGGFNLQPPTEQRKLLFRLISTFQITKDNADTLRLQVEQLSQEPDEKAVIYTLQLLTQMETNVKDGVKLTASDMSEVLKKVGALAKPFNKTTTENTIEDYLGACYARDFFEKLKASDISKELISLIDKEFPESEDNKQVLAVLRQFNQAGDQLSYGELVKKIAIIVAPMSADEKDNFLKNLQRRELYQPVSKDDKARLEVAQFNELLDAIMSRGHANDFIYLLAQNESKNTDALVQKASLYLTTILPDIEKNTSDVVSKMDVLRLVTQLLLSSSAESLTTATEVNRAEQSKLSDLNKALANEEGRRSDYPSVFQDLFKSIYKIAEQYPGAKGLIIEFIQNYISSCKPNDGSLIVNAWDCVATMRQEFGNLNDPDVVRSLCFHYSGKEGMFTPSELLALMRNEDYQKLSKDNKKLILRTVSVLLNNEKYFESNQIIYLIQLCNDEQNGPVFLSKLKEFYKNAPYPELKQVKQWDEVAKASESYAQALADQYAAFDKRPCAREIGSENEQKDNGFNLKMAREKAKQFKGISYSENELLEMAQETANARNLSTADLLAEFKKFRNSPREPNLTHVKLVSLAAELLYRSKGKDGGHGSSFEINTTQYLAVLGTLKSRSHNTSEIGTGEGKSRIMALCNACQFGLGKTVDFVTSDVQLATRDYLEFQAFYSLLGAQTNIIYTDTPVSEYRIGGINYSDASNLSLFRNKARSTGNGDKVIDPEEKNRVLSLDEADKTYFDVSDIRFNFSTEGNKALKGMEWVYPLLIEYFSDNKTYQDLYYNDIDACNRAFLNFANSRLSPEQVSKLKALPQGQLESWQEAAITARSLIFEKDFVIQADTTISTPFGPKIASEAKLIIENRVSKNSKFSFGVHQCLHARLNWLKQHPDMAKPEENSLVQELARCQQSFDVATEKQIIYSSTNKSLLDDYANGGLIAVTGTAGSIIEREEATNLYGTMQFVSVPRHKGLYREDRPIRLTANSKGQIEALVEYIQEARRNNQPVLVLCENDNASKAMQKALEKALVNKKPAGTMQRIDSQLSREAEAELITEAGRPGMVTVSTSMVGRGTDIKLQGQASEHGLKVLLSYLPRDRDMKQMLGRSGRFGARGDTRIVLNKEELKTRLGKTTLNEGFYTAPETYIRQQQALMDRKIQCERLIKNTISDFSRSLTNNFFKEFLANTEAIRRKELYPAWMKFTKEKDQLWNTVWPQISKEMDKTNPDPALINKHLAEYQKKTQELWNDLYLEVSDIKLQGLNKPEENPIKFLHKEVGELKLDDKTTKLINGFDVKKVVPHETKIYHKYDPAHDGRAVVYSRPFEKLRAFFNGERKLFADYRAWKEGHGILFPNLRALWNGHMTFGQFLFGYSSPNPIGSGSKESSLQETSPESTELMNNGLGVSNSNKKKPHSVPKDRATHQSSSRFFSGSTSSQETLSSSKPSTAQKGNKTP